jgi:hypothetical protein
MRAAPSVSVVTSGNTNITQGTFSITGDGFESNLSVSDGAVIEVRRLRTIYQADAEL